MPLKLHGILKECSIFSHSLKKKKIQLVLLSECSQNFLLFLLVLDQYPEFTQHDAYWLVTGLLLTQLQLIVNTVGESVTNSGTHRHYFIPLSLDPLSWEKSQQKYSRAQAFTAWYAWAFLVWSFLNGTKGIAWDI